MTITCTGNRDQSVEGTSDFGDSVLVPSDSGTSEESETPARQARQ